MSDESELIAMAENSMEISCVVNNNEMSQVISGQLLGNKHWPVVNEPSIQNNILFEIIDSEDDAQELIDLSDEVQVSNAAQHLLTMFDDELEKNVPETPPPPQEDSSQWNASNVAEYLFNNNILSNKKSSNKVSKPQSSISSKRNSTMTVNKRPVKIKKVEGYSCKLNGKMYQVVSRDLDVLEEIEKGLQDIQKKLQQNKDYYNVRPLSLQLNQIETVLGALEDDRLDLGMSREAWDEMMLCTRAMFNDTQTELESSKNRKLGFLADDDLSTSFSQNLNISCRKQSTNRPKQRSIPTSLEKNKSTRKSKNNHPKESVFPKSPQQDENEIQILDSFQVDNANRNKPVDHGSNSKKGTAKENPKVYRGSKKMSTNKKSVITERPNPQSRILNPLPTGNVHHQNEELSQPLFEDEPLITSSPCCSQNIITSTQLIRSDSQSNETLDMLLVNSQSTMLEQPTQQQPTDSQISIPPPAAISDTRLVVNKIRFENDFNADQEDSCVIYDSQQQFPSQSIGKRCGANDEKFNRLSKMVLFNFHLRPFVTKGVLSPGKNTLKMNFNNRVYIASLTADGTIEMNGFTFTNIGNWIKSVEGKRFGRFSKRIQRTLELLYNGKPLEDLLEQENSGELTQPVSNGSLQIHPAIPSLPDTSINKDVPMTTKITEVNSKNENDLQLIPDEMTRHIQKIFLHAPEEYFPICQCIEQFWTGAQPFPRYLLEEVDSW